MYCFFISYKQKKVFLTDLTQDRAKKKFGFDLELVNSVKDKDSLQTITPRVLRSYPGFELVEEYQKPKYVMTPEHKQALINSKLGKPRSEEVRQKISQTKKGKSNFEGKRHSYETRRVMAARKIGNQHNKNYVWAHNPTTDEEIMVKSRMDIPSGFSQGRDFLSVEPGLYEIRLRASYGK